MSIIDDPRGMSAEDIRELYRKQQQKDKLSPEQMRKAIEVRDEKTLLDMDITPDQFVTIYSGLMATTPLILGDDVADIYRLYLGNREEITLGLDPATGKVVNTRIISVPDEVRVDTFLTLDFSCGLKIQCTPPTQILAYESDTKVDFLSARSLKVGQKIVGFGVREVGGMSERVFTLLDKQEETNILTLPAYLFIAEHQNVFIPSAGGVDGDALSFIVIHQ